MNVDGKQGPDQGVIRVFVVHDHPMIRCGLAALLRSEHGMQCVGEASDGDEAISLALAARPQVMVMGLRMPRMAGIAAMQALRPLLADTRFVMLAGEAAPRELRRALAAGASAALPKSTGAMAVVEAIRSAYQGQQALTPAQPGAAPDTPPAVGANLTQRERDLLVLLARGCSNQNICNALGIALPTVKYHVTHILTKLRADNRTEAVLVALRHQLVELQQAAPR